MTTPTKDRGRSGGDRATPKDTSTKPDHISPNAGEAKARYVPIGDVLPRLTLGVDFELAHLRGETYIAFRRCPCCRRHRRSKKTALMHFDHPAFPDPIGYLLDERCGRKLNGTSSRSNEAAQVVGKQVLAAVVSVKRMAGEPLPDALIVSDLSSVVCESGGVQ